MKGGEMMVVGLDGTAGVVLATTGVLPYGVPARLPFLPMRRHGANGYKEGTAMGKLVLILLAVALVLLLASDAM